MKTVLAVIGAIFLLFVFGLFALCGDEDDSQSLRSLQISGGLLEPVFHGVGSLQRDVAPVAQDAANLAGNVAMIDAQRALPPCRSSFSFVLAAEGATVPLTCQQQFVLFGRQPEFALTVEGGHGILADAFSVAAVRFPHSAGVSLPVFLGLNETIVSSLDIPLAELLVHAVPAGSTGSSYAVPLVEREVADRSFKAANSTALHRSFSHEPDSLGRGQPELAARLAPADHERERCYGYECREGGSGNEGEYRDDNRRAGISPGPFDRSPVDFRDNRVTICFPFARCDARDEGGEGEPQPGPIQ